MKCPHCLQWMLIGQDANGKIVWFCECGHEVPLAKISNAAITAHKIALEHQAEDDFKPIGVERW